MLAHTPTERMRAAFQAILPLIPPDERGEATLNFYRRLAHQREDAETRGLYSVPEALGVVPLYRLWLASRE